MATRLRSPLVVGALTALLVAATLTGIGVAAARPSATEGWGAPRLSDGLIRGVVTLRTTTDAPGTAARPAVTSVTSGAHVAPALLATSVSALPQLDVTKHQRAREELGDGGQLAPGEVDGAPVALYVVGDQARVVSTGPAWAVAAPKLAPPEREVVSCRPTRCWPSCAPRTACATSRTSVTGRTW